VSSRCYNAHIVNCAPRAAPRNPVQKQTRSVVPIGEWLSLVEHLLREQGVGGSNPLSPTNKNHLLVSGTRRGTHPNRVKDISFAGLSTELPQADLQQAFKIQRGDIADGEEIGNGIGNLIILFRRRGKDVAVVPTMTFDDALSTVSLRFDIVK
jgi:hypothetical protein